MHRLLLALLLLFALPPDAAAAAWGEMPEHPRVSAVAGTAEVARAPGADHLLSTLRWERGGEPVGSGPAPAARRGPLPSLRSGRNAAAARKAVDPPVRPTAERLPYHATAPPGIA